ncbi:MAG: TolC family protein [Cytophagales bacterium]|jgi:outer membrane protein TolC|nr:TolC family protein [Cytophagales bacterium]
MKKSFLTLLALVFAVAVQAQSHLDTYIRQGFDNNESLKQQHFVLQRNLYALKEAKALFLPNVSFNTTYTVAAGGRTVDFPVGDLLNPVYNTLNRMTDSRAFPQVENQRILLNPNNFYDTKLRTTYPVINAEINYNKRIKQQQYDLQRTEIDIYKRELAKEIKVAYYRFLQATESVRIYNDVRRLVLENQRINESLFNNQKANRTAVIRSTNEVTKIEAQLEAAHQTQQSAQAYVNFLINRPPYADIAIDSVAGVPNAALLENDTTITGREELAKLNQAQAINHNLVGLAQSYRIPKLNAFADLGSQAFDFQVNNRTAYYFAGISLDWNVFAGGRNQHRVKQAQYDGLAIGANTGYVTQQLRLQMTTAINARHAALAQYRAALSQVAASQKYYQDVQRLYKEGQAIYVELLDAQNQYITDQLQLNISRFDVWIRQAEVERANASFALD